MMTLSVPITVQIDDKQMRQIARSYLSWIKQEQWVELDRSDKPVLMHEVATSHKFDMPVDYQDPVRIKIIQAVQEFEKALKEYEENFEKGGRK